jgi:chloramphenicol 3-O-phosphotransferase
MTPTRSKLVLLAGPSCTGKTTLGHAAKESMGLPWVFWEIDRIGPRLPASAVIRPEAVATLTPTRLETALAMQDQLVEASLAAIRAYVDAGFSVFAEVFIWDRRHMEIARRVLRGIDPLVVELRCPVEILERREHARATTFTGTARAQADREWLISPDLVLDATRVPEDLVTELTTWLASHPTAQWSMVVSREA